MYRFLVIIDTLACLLFENKVWTLSREDLESEMESNPEFVVGMLRKLAEEVRGQSKVRFSCRGSAHAREPDDQAEVEAFFS